MTILTISNITIHQDTDGRYSLNDLHKAAGNKQKHKPVHWQALQQTKELIEEISKVEIPTFIPLSVKKAVTAEPTFVRSWSTPTPCGSAPSSL
ncbi:KilA-N domain-containing protein [Pectobacterium aquaticum]|uniref:KilA-N domain-containing protein n=1 Tax=Pectobacterium aquaticum TaxID=2204145 RepID=UPI0021F737D6|nr:KilA-N domain-containing protein [Pectobacterium aquaticum]